MPEQIKGYLELVKDALDLHPNEEIIKRRKTTIRSLNRNPSFILFVEPNAADILAEWDPSGNKKRLREQLDLTQEDPERIRRLILVVDGLLDSMTADSADKIKQHYQLNEPEANIPTHTNMEWVYSNPMQMFHAGSGKIGHFLLYEPF